MTKPGYSKSQLEDPLREIAHAGFYVFAPEKYLPPTTVAEGRRTNTTLQMTPDD